MEREWWRAGEASASGGLPLGAAVVCVAVCPLEVAGAGLVAGGGEGGVEIRLEGVVHPHGEGIGLRVEVAGGHDEAVLGLEVRLEAGRSHNRSWAAAVGVAAGGGRSYAQTESEGGGCGAGCEQPGELTVHDLPLWVLWPLCCDIRYTPLGQKSFKICFLALNLYLPAQVNLHGEKWSDSRLRENDVLYLSITGIIKLETFGGLMGIKGVWTK